MKSYNLPYDEAPDSGPFLHSGPVLRRGNHCAYDMHYHLVFVVKYRRALLRPEVEVELARISAAIAERHEIEVERLEADLNHVHLLCSAHPKVSASDIARIYKSITARELFKALPALRKELWGGAFWSAGYYSATVGHPGGWPALVRYVEQQGQKSSAINLRLLFDAGLDAGQDEQPG